MAMSFMPGHDLRGGEIDRIEPRGAEPVDLHARHLLAEARLQNGRAGDIAAGFADGIDTTEHHVFHQFRVEIVAAADGVEGGDGQIHRRHLMERAIGLSPPAGRANRVKDIGVWHRSLPGIVIVTSVRSTPGMVSE